MALDAQALAKKLHDALGQKADGNGKPTKISDQTLNYAKGIVAALKAAVVSNAPGTINGVTAPGAPLSGGTGTGGLMVMTAAPMLAETAKGVDPLAIPKIQLENAAIVQYIGTALINFSTVTGSCTNTPTSPGPLAAGAAAGGTLTGLTGAGAVSAVSAAIGTAGPDMIKHYNALIDYISANAKAAYAANSIVGVCPPGGGPLTAGAGTGGTIA